MIKLKVQKIKKETEEISLKLPFFFIQENDYVKEIYVISKNKEQDYNVEYKGLSLFFQRNDKKSNWVFHGLKKNVWERHLERLLENDDNYTECKSTYFKAAMKEVAKGMENVIDNLDEIFKTSINSKNSKNEK